MADITEELVNIHSTFYKVNSDYKVLKNEEYELASVDGRTIGLAYEKKPDGRFILDSQGLLAYENASYILPNFILEKIKSVETVDDLYSIFGSNDYYEIVHYTGLYILSFEFPIVIKQTVAEPGYGMHDIIAQALGGVYYYADGNGNITSASTWFILTLFNNVAEPDTVTNKKYIYDDVERSFNTESDFANFDFKEFGDDDWACMSTNAGIIITDEECGRNDLDYGSEPFGSGSYSYLPYFVESRVPVTLTIDNKVNGNIKYNAYKDKALEYIITISNTGDYDSTGNIIVTHIPSGVTVDTNSISNSGIYDAEAETITWNVETLVAGASLEFSYKATAPSNTNGKELIGSSSIISDQVPEGVLSANTIVTLDRIIEVINNPETGTMVYIANTNIGMSLSTLVVVTILICMMFAICIKKYKFLKK